MSTGCTGSSQSEHPIKPTAWPAVLSKMMNFGVKLGWRADNPVRGLERNHEDRRERYLSPAELGGVPTNGIPKEACLISTTFILPSSGRTHFSSTNR
jgi:hypothetical protein